MSEIEDKYAALGGQSGFLGGPIGLESPTQDGIGRFRDFQFGSIYWTPQTGAHEIHGAIRDKWISLGQEVSFLGYPTTDETQSPDVSWRFNHFQDGSILWPRIGWPAQPGAQSYRSGKSGVFGTASPKWGLLASPGVDGQPIRSTYFFAGNWRFGIQKFYEYFVCPNDFLYTIHPSDARHLGWSEQVENRSFVLDAMAQAGANVINLSYWGNRGTDRWAFWAPMHTSTFAHDEVFNAAIGTNILIAPYIEESVATNFDPHTGLPLQCGADQLGHTGNSPGYSFADDFPGTPTDPAPILIEQILDLVDRYLLKPQNPQWPGKWAQMYDQDGQKRHIVSIIHARSNQFSIDDQTFAAGLDSAADKVLSAKNQNYVRGITFNTWNGYTEGYAAVPTLEYGNSAFVWLQSLFQLLS